jgi:hypothetical protein
MALPSLGTKDVSRVSLDDFIRVNGLTAHVLIVDRENYNGPVKVELWDLSPFTRFDAYDDRHFGNVWCNKGKDVCAVVAPALLVFTQHHQKKTAWEKSKMTLRCTLRWAGKRWKLDASFKSHLKNPVKAGEEYDGRDGGIYASTKALAHSLTK